MDRSRTAVNGASIRGASMTKLRIALFGRVIDITMRRRSNVAKLHRRMLKEGVPLVTGV